MKCDRIQELLSLYLYRELPLPEESAVDWHIRSCAHCQSALDAERSLHAAIDTARIAPPAGLLADCRRSLPDLLRDAPVRPESRPSRWETILAWVRPAEPRLFWMRPAGALALVALGFFAARLTSVQPVYAPSDEAPAAVRVRSVSAEPSGRVTLTVDETRQSVLAGGVDEEPIRRLLLEGARNPADPGVRAESVDVLRASSRNPEVRDALLFALQNDPNAGVRLKALEALQPYAGEPASHRALAQVLLRDDNSGVRSRAVDILIQTGHDDMVEILQGLLEREDNVYVRSRSQEALRAMNASLETF
jgi:HEAT repeats/Putative zinc-finger